MFAIALRWITLFIERKACVALRHCTGEITILSSSCIIKTVCNTRLHCTMELYGWRHVHSEQWSWVHYGNAMVKEASVALLMSIVKQEQCHQLWCLVKFLIQNHKLSFCWREVGNVFVLVTSLLYLHRRFVQAKPNSPNKYRMKAILKYLIVYNVPKLK